MIVLEDDSPGPFPIGQVRFNSYLPSENIFLDYRPSLQDGTVSSPASTRDSPGNELVKACHFTDLIPLIFYIVHDGYSMTAMAKAV